MDLAGTILDWAGATPGTNMTTVSLRPFLSSGNAPRGSYRPFVSSGLSSWRAVVQSASDGAIYKLICCRGVCPGQPSNATAAGGTFSRAPSTVWVGGSLEEYPLLADSGAELVFSSSPRGDTAANHTLLYDIVSDPYDTRPLQAEKPGIVAEMAKLLPPGWCGGTAQ